MPANLASVSAPTKTVDAYPDTWPTPDPSKPQRLHSRITDKQKADLYNRLVTTRELATSLGVHEKHLSSRFPGKKPIIDTKVLMATRREYKTEIGRQVLEGRYTIREASAIVHCSYNTMQRYVAKAKALHPHLAPKFQELVQHNRKIRGIN